VYVYMKRKRKRERERKRNINEPPIDEIIGKILVKKDYEI
jgi:hypothetical protein